MGRMEHYLVCPYGLPRIRVKLRLRQQPIHLHGAMLLDGLRREDTVLSATALYALRGTVHKLRAQNTRASPTNIQKHLWEQVRIAALHHKALGKQINKLWADM